MLGLRESKVGKSRVELSLVASSLTFHFAIVARCRSVLPSFSFPDVDFFVW